MTSTATSSSSSTSKLQRSTGHQLLVKGENGADPTYKPKRPQEDSSDSFSAKAASLREGIWSLRGKISPAVPHPYNAKQFAEYSTFLRPTVVFPGPPIAGTPLSESELKARRTSTFGHPGSTTRSAAPSFDQKNSKARRKLSSRPIGGRQV
ncbi:hypothetical protein BC829DRAFT_186323 [Chytridium lagenaria]|nr:hypothetical protein BC829DRAFT_186323 [Chytridium lagenaria]